MTLETAEPQPEAPAPPPVPAPAPAPHTYPFTFTGDAREYFRIWIVNLFLSVITLGIYSPWARVRKKRYFYGNTWVAGANFDYHGNPVAILKGRIIAVLALVAYNVVGHYVPRLGTAVLLAAMIAAPWLIMRTFQFNAAYSSYRNVRFHFRGNYLGGLKAIAPLFLFPLLLFVFPPLEGGRLPASGADVASAIVPTLPLVFFYPYVVAALKRYHVGYSSFGGAEFGLRVKTRTFYGIYIAAWFLGGLVVAGLGVIMAFAAVALMGSGATEALGFIAYLFAAAIVFGYTRSRITNLVFNSATLADGKPFVSRVSARKLGGIYATNMLSIAASLGLLVPWAAIRTARYRASCLAVEADSDIEEFFAGVAAPSGVAVGAAGEQIGEFFDVDLSL